MPWEEQSNIANGLPFIVPSGNTPQFMRRRSVCHHQRNVKKSHSSVAKGFGGWNRGPFHSGSSLLWCQFPGPAVLRTVRGLRVIETAERVVAPAWLTSECSHHPLSGTGISATASYD